MTNRKKGRFDKKKSCLFPRSILYQSNKHDHKVNKASKHVYTLRHHETSFIHTVGMNTRGELKNFTSLYFIGFHNAQFSKVIKRMAA